MEGSSNHFAILTGVPVSTQWESGGYYYPTQIAQFGLSHYSKNLTEPEPRRKVLEDGERDIAPWLTNGPAAITRAHDVEVNSIVVQFQTAGISQSISFPLVFLFIFSCHHSNHCALQQLVDQCP